MRIALISPKGPLYRHRTGIFRKDLRAAPLTLTTLASLIPAELDVQVKLYDEGIEELPRDFEADLVGMTVISGSAMRSYELSAQFRSKQIPVVLGGPHVTLVPHDAQQYADSIVVGYAEETWPQLLRDFAQGNMKKRYDMASDFSFDRLGSIPFPRRDLLRKRSYRTIHTFEATRGCVHSCEFCVVPSAWGKNPFQKPVSHVIDDIRQSGARRIVFYDLNLFADFAYVRELLTALLPLNVQWFGLSTVLIEKDRELIELAARSGCKGLLIGFETLSPAGLDEYQKQFNDPETYGELVRVLHNHGIAINGTFVLGHDHDDPQTFDQVRDFVLTHEIDLPRFAVLTPFPGTPLFSRLEQEDRILSRDWSLYDGQHVVYQPKRLSPEKLQSEHERIWREVYSYRSIIRRIQLRWPTFPILFGANVAYRYYAHNLARFYTCRGGVV